MSKNFEQQVKNILDDVQFEPGEQVWQHVRHAIKPEKKKKRFIFWWILPVVLTGAAVLYMTGGVEKTNSIAENNNEIKKSGDQVGVTDLIINANELNQTSSDETKKLTLIESSSVEKQSPLIVSKEITSTFIELNQKNEKSQPIINGNSLVTEENESVTNKVTEPADAIMAKEEVLQEPVITETTGQKPEITKIDTVASVSAPVITNKMPVSRKWNFGLTAEIGLSNKVNSLMKGTDEAMMDVLYTIPNSTSSGSIGPQTVNKKTTSSARMLLGIGVAAKRNLSRKISFQSSLSYQQQSFSVSTNTYKDSLIQGSVSPILKQRNTDNYKLHAANVYTGLTYDLIGNVDMKLSLGAGIDNQFLFAVKHAQQNNYNSFTQQFSSANNSTAQPDYRKWQPYINIRLIADFQLKQKRSLQLSPYLRYGVLNFEKQASSKNHLMSFGLSSTYFFR